MDLARVIADLRTRGGERTDVEVKSGAGGLPESFTETLSAFANLPGGGVVIVGLDEATGFSPVGLKQAATVAAGLASRARQALEPAVHIDVAIERFEGSDLVVGRVRELPPSAKPCFVRRTGRAYMRFADGDFAMSQLEIDGFITSRTRPRFDEARVPGATFGDLDRQRVSDYLVTARRMDGRLAKLSDDTELLVRSGVTTHRRRPYRCRADHARNLPAAVPAAVHDPGRGAA